MKILQINAVNKVGSTGRNVFELSEYLIKNGYESAVAYSKGENTGNENEYIIGSLFDAKIHAFMSRLTGKQGYYSFSSTKKLLIFINSFSPDVVVLHNLHGNYINLHILLKFLSENKIPTVVVLHDCWFYTGKCCHYTVDNCYKWQTSCGNCPCLKKYNKSWFFDKTKKMLNDKIKLFGEIDNLAVIGVSNWITGQAKNSTVLKNAKEISTIYNWIDTDIFSPQADNKLQNLKKELLLSDKKIILSVSSFWSKEKGIDAILELSEKISNDEQILLVGNLPSDIQLNSKITNIKVTDSVEKLAEIYSLADVFVQPSLQETFGKVTAEALSCGTPVVCFDVTANPELIGENCGAVVKKGDIEGMYNAVAAIIKNKKLFYTNDCRNFAIEKFNMETNLNKYVKLFEKIIENKS